MNIVYERDEIEAGPLFPGMKFYRKPDLPKRKFKANNIDFTVTDLRTLNEDAARVILTMLSFCCENNDVDEFNIRILPDADPDLVELIIDIVHGFGWSAKKKGRYGYDLHSGLVIGSEREGDIVTFKIVKQFSNAMRDYYLSLEDKTNVPLFGLIIACVQSSIKGFREGMSHETGEPNRTALAE